MPDLTPADLRVVLPALRDARERALQSADWFRHHGMPGRRYWGRTAREHADLLEARADALQAVIEKLAK